MGVDYYATSLVGVKIKNHNVNKQIRGCSHPEQNSRFCSECGSPMWRSSSELNPKIEELRETYNHSSGLSVAYSTDQEYYFVGVYLTSSDNSRRREQFGKTELPPIINTQEIKVKLMAYLGDMYDENEFGLWTILYCSY